MTRKSKREIERQLEQHEREQRTNYADYSTEELYMMVLRAANDESDESHPGAWAEYKRRWQAHKEKQQRDRDGRVGDNR